MTSHADVLGRHGRLTTLTRWAGVRSIRRLSARGRTGLVTVLTGATLLVLVGWPRHVPAVALAPVIVVAGLYLPPRRLWPVYGVVSFAALVVVPVSGVSAVSATLTGASLAALIAMMCLVAHSRTRAGVTGLRGEGFFVDLRDKLVRSAQVPPLPDPWVAEHRVDAARGDAFSGDFLVAARIGHRLEVALVDVSGTGQRAGPRALALAAAFGGIVGSVPADRFLETANRYLIRQRWEEGFATAVHVEIDLRSGRGSVGRAGHPPAVVYRSGAGAWRPVAGPAGPVLGVMADLRFPREPLDIGVGDILMLYSDGVIESRGHDLSEGFDRMLGAATRALIGGGGVVDAACDAARAGNSDDRAAFVLRRG